MKRFLCFLTLAAALALALASCDDGTTTTTSPYISVGKTNVIISYEGGGTSFYCKAYNVEGGALSAEADSSWVCDFDFSVEDTVSFSVGMNESREVRTATVKIMYISDLDTLATKTVTVSQELNNYYSLEATEAEGYYYGVANIYNNEGNVQFYLCLSDTALSEDGTFADGGTYYTFDIWTGTQPEGTNYVSLPEGEYTFGQVGENGVFSDESGYYVTWGEDDEFDEDEDEEDRDEYKEHYDFSDGTLTVTNLGSVTTITADVEDSNGGVHHVTYSGELYFENESLMSTLDGELSFGDFSSVACEARYYGDYFKTGTANWVLCMYPETGSGFTIDLCAPAAYDLDGGIPTGTFTAASSDGQSMAFATGGIYSNYISGTWFVTLDEDGKLVAPYAPVEAGTIEISASGDSYTININVYDDRENLITATWTGSPTLSDYTTTSSLSSTSSKARRAKAVIPFRRANPFE
ncbi:MAG: hypothetical protein LUC24_04125 [Bacteroidales bacterium]|nr:hypothetical protein [Bacteroidales bacterium]